MGKDAKNAGAAGAADAGTAVDADADAGALDDVYAGLDELSDKDNKETARVDARPPADEDKDPADEGDPADQADPEDGQFGDGELAGLGAKAQEKVNARIHGLNVKRKDAEAKAAELEGRLKEFDGQLDAAHVSLAVASGLPPEYVTAAEAKTLERYQKLRMWKRWCNAHREGYEGDGDKEAMSVAEVAERGAAIEDELLDLAGPAQSLLRERAKQWRADAEAGRRLRLAREQGRKPGTAVRPKPPRLPPGGGAGGGGAARRPPVSAGGQKERGAMDDKEFAEDGADESALEKQYKKIFGDG